MGMKERVCVSVVVFCEVPTTDKKEVRLILLGLIKDYLVANLLFNVILYCEIYNDRLD